MFDRHQFSYTRQSDNDLLPYKVCLETSRRCLAEGGLGKITQEGRGFPLSNTRIRGCRVGL